jgi:hypothetical protein
MDVVARLYEAGRRAAASDRDDSKSRMHPPDRPAEPRAAPLAQITRLRTRGVPSDRSRVRFAAHPSSISFDASRETRPGMRPTPRHRLRPLGPGVVEMLLPPRTGGEKGTTSRTDVTDRRQPRAPCGKGPRSASGVGSRTANRRSAKHRRLQDAT